jgi:nucleoside 2-deoxyribosyltransferase
MYIYLAGKWSDKEDITHKMSQLTNMGHKITHDWTLNESVTREPSDLGKFAQLDIDGVLMADCFIGVMTDIKYAYRGTFTEIGCAIGTEKKIFIYCPDKESYCKTNCFFYHPSIVHFNTWEELIESIKTK